MKWQVSENSLFAVLLRSPWWVSFLVAAGVFALMRYFLPAMYASAGALPIAVIGCVAGWKQFRAPSAKKIAARLEVLPGFLQEGRLSFAGHTPGGPDVDQDHFAFEVGDCIRLAVEAFQSEIWGRLAHRDPALLVVVQRQADHYQQD